MFILIKNLKSSQSKTSNIKILNINIVYLIKNKGIKTLQLGKLIVWKNY